MTHILLNSPKAYNNILENIEEEFDICNNSLTIERI